MRAGVLQSAFGAVKLEVGALRAPTVCPRARGRFPARAPMGVATSRAHARDAAPCSLQQAFPIGWPAMARITVEDCLERVPNRFELVLLAARRAKQLLKGARPLVESDNKDIVTALREVAEEKVRIHYDE